MIFKKGNSKIEGRRRISNQMSKHGSAREKEIAVGIHCDAGQILTRAGNRAQIGICGFVRKQNFKKTDVEEFHQGVAISWVINKIPRVITSEEAGGIQAVFYGFDMAMMLKGLLSELLFGNVGVKYRHMYETIIARQCIK